MGKLSFIILVIVAVVFVVVVVSDISGSAIRSKCTDSDNGLDYYTKGIVKPANGGLWNDRCGGEEAPNTLKEFTCKTGGSWEITEYDCASEGKTCKDGACA